MTPSDKRRYWRAQRVIDTLKDRPVYLKDGSVVKFIRDRKVGLIDVFHHGGEVATPTLEFDRMFDDVDWEKTDP